MNFIRNNRPGALARGLAKAVLAATVFVATTASAQQFWLHDAAGNYVGEGLPATEAAITAPIGIAFDAQGYGYVADRNGHRIRRISPDGSMVITIAGTGEPGFGGDGGLANAAMIDSPYGLVVDAAGNVLFADGRNGRVRRISANGVITTVAGNGTYAYTGDGGPAVGAGLKAPYGLALDADGNLFISDWEAHVIRRVSTAGVISTVAGTGQAGFSGDGGSARLAMLNLPEGMDFDAYGNLYFADALNHRIRRISPAGTITTVAGNGTVAYVAEGTPAVDASVYYPFNVIVDPEGGLVFSDARCYLRRVVDGIMTTVAGNGWCIYNGEGMPAHAAGIGAAEGMAFDDEGNFYFADPDNGRISRIDTTTWVVDTAAGIGTYRGDGTQADSALLSTIYGLAFGPSGDLYVADTYPNRRIRRIDPEGYIHTVAGNGGFFEGDYPTATLTGINNPADVAVDASGNVYYSERYRGVVRRVHPDGTVTTVAGNGSRAWSGDGGSAVAAGIDPVGLAVDAVGNLYIADATNHRVRRVTPDGAISTIAGNGIAGFSGDGGNAGQASLNFPHALAFDAAGNLYIADATNNRVRKVTPAGLISTVAGNGTRATGGEGDGGPATSASLGFVRGLAVDRNGILYLAGKRLRRVTPDGRIDSIDGWRRFAMDVAVDAQGVAYVATADGRVVQVASIPPIASDFDLDAGATSDLYWRNASTGESVIWRSANSRLPIRVTRVTSLAWQVEALGDFDGDGKSDVFWRNRNTGENVIWNGAVSSRSRPVPAVSPVWQLAAAADFDGDHVDDVMWRNTRTGANLVWRSADSTTPMAVMGVTNLSWKVVGAGDFDGDGREDLMWRDGQRGKNVIWRGADGMDPQSMVGVTDLAWQVAGVGDFNADGRADVLWRQEDRGTNVIWRSGNAATQQDVTDVTNPAWVVAGVGDYNGDGRSDILWRHGTTGANVIWRSASSSQQQAVSGVTNTEWTVID